MTPLQNKLLDMLEWYCEFCKKHKLNYYVTGGTLLGAARHKGFIPWDDDIDVCMPRPDYDMFIMLTKNIGGKYYVDSPYDNSQDYLCTYTKIYDTTTTLIETGRYPIVRGVFIDVFPVDGAGNTIDSAISYYKKKIDPIKMFHMARITTVREGRSIGKNVFITATHLVPDWILDNRTLAKKVDEKCKARSYNNFEIVGNLMSTYREKSIFPKSIIGEYSEMEFEGIVVKGVQDYDAFLSLFYGDWRKLPPKEKQVTTHDFIKLDLTTPYK